VCHPALVRVVIQYTTGCVQHQEMTLRVRSALAATGNSEIVIQHRRVATETEAELLGFIGSPTLRLNGLDPFSEPGAVAGLACRIYQTADGAAGCPSLAQLIQAVGLAAIKRPPRHRREPTPP
jgi:hypothetical protein